MVILLLLLSVFAHASGVDYQSPIIFGDNDRAVLLQNNLSFNDNAFFLTGTIDPSAVATSAPQGSLYLRYGAGGGELYQKQDNGLTTNWDQLGSGVGGAVASVNGQTGVVVLDSDDISEGSINLYFTDARARLAAIADSITDGVTNIGPSQNAVFDALALKQDIVSASPSTLAYFNSSGDLDYLSQWSVDDLGYFSNITSIGSGDTRSDFSHIRIQTNLGGTITGPARSLNLSLQGNGTTDSAVGLQLDLGLPITNSAIIGQFSSSNSTTVGGNLTGVGIYTDSPVVGDVTSLAIGNSNSVGGQFYGIQLNNQATIAGSGSGIHSSNGGTVTGNFSLFSDFNNGDVGQDFSHINLGNDGDVGQTSRGVNIGENNDITKSAIAYSYYHNGNIGDGTGTNAFLLDSNFNSGTIDGGVFLLNNSSNATITGSYNGMYLNSNGASLGTGGTAVQWNNGSPFTANNASIYAVNMSNSAAGYRFGGISLYNSGNMGEEVRGFNFTDQNTSSRTKTGIDINISGTATDDAQGIRVNVENQSSTNQYVYSGQFNGGKFGVSGSFIPKSGQTVDVGNNISTLVTVPSGSPLTGTDLLMTLIQPSFLADDDVAMGPIGLGSNMVAAVSQVAVGSGKTIPMLRSLLVGTSIPQGSGGTITEHRVIELLGLPSFGGSATNPERIGIIDSNLLGQNFCDGATDCWMIRNADETAENHLGKLSIGTASKKVSTNNKLEIHDGHLGITQPTDPTATVNANAGTGATCDVVGSDHSFVMTLVTGSVLQASGEQCEVSFAKAFANAPNCVFSPVNSEAAQALSNAYISPTTTTETSMNFVSPDVISTTYEWAVHCL